MLNLNKIYLFRMVHIENMPHILQYGITHSSSANTNSNFVPIGDNSLISRRNSFLLKNGRCLGEYIPFYFGKRMPMLYVVQNGFNMVASTPAENIIYCLSSVQKIIDLNLDFVFTSGHAVSALSSQHTQTDIQSIYSIIDKSAIDAFYWNDERDLDKKRRKEAEFLVLGDIAPTGILGYITYNTNAQKQIIGLGVEPSKVLIKPEYYF